MMMFLITNTFDRQSLLLQKEELDDLDVGYDYKLRQESLHHNVHL